MPDDVPIDARQVLLSVKDRVPWALKFHDQLVDSPAARRAFENLVSMGCDPVDLLFQLNFCCCGYATSYAKERREIGDEIASLGRRVLSDAKQLQRFEASGSKRNVGKALQLPEFQGLSVKLRAYAECLVNEGTALKHTSARRSPGQAIGWLGATVEGSTDGTHYHEIAKLMEAHYLMRGIHKDISSQAVAKQVKRFRQRSAMAYSHLKNMTSRQLGRYKEKTFLDKFPWLIEPKQAEN